VRIREIVWLDAVVDKLAFKHRVETEEVEEVLQGRPRVRFVEKGRRAEEDVYMACGQTDAGRYLSVLFIYKPGAQALILTARDMAPRERKRYERK